MGTHAPPQKHTLMMKFAPVLALAALTVAVPIQPDSPEPAHRADPMPEMFMQLMKDVMSPAATGSQGGADPVVKDVMGLISSLAQPSSGGNGKGPMDDPMIKMMTTLAQTAMTQVGGDSSGDNTDPMLKMGMAGMKAFMETMNGQDSSTPADRELEEGGHAPAPSHDDPLAPLMNLMMKGMQALASDKKGDPVGAVMNVVLEDPVMSANPVIKAVKAAVNDKTGDPLNAMIDSLMAQPEMQKDPYVLPILRIAKNVISNMPKDGESGDPLAALLNALAGPPKNPRATKALVSPDAVQ